MPWIFDPHSGGDVIPANNRASIAATIEVFSYTRRWSSRFKLQPRFKGQFCYIDVLDGSGDRPDPLCRLRYFSMTSWSFAFYTWSNEQYQPCAFPSGEMLGTVEEAIVACEMHLC
jgi:hypothetical protein